MFNADFSFKYSYRACFYNNYVLNQHTVVLTQMKKAPLPGLFVRLIDLVDYINLVVIP